MTSLEICLLIAGIIMMVGSFFVTEKLSQKEIEEFTDLSSKEIERILQTQITKVQEKMAELIDKSVDEAVEKAQRPLEKITNEKIMSISEYSETVTEQINKNHNEVMFLYSMLNDKQEDIKTMVDAIDKSKVHIQSMLKKMVKVTESLGKTSNNSSSQKVDQSKPQAAQNSVPQKKPVNNESKQTQQESVDDAEKVLNSKLDEANSKKVLSKEEVLNSSDKADETDNVNKKEEILKRYRAGMSIVDIARELCLGLGEVKLVIDLFKGEKG